MLNQSSSFYVSLSSARSKDIFPNNRTNSFKNHLAREIRLDGDWEVALTELHYTSSINTSEVPAKIQFNIYRFDDLGKIKGQVIIKGGGPYRVFSVPLEYNLPNYEDHLTDFEYPSPVKSFDSIVINIPVGSYSPTTLVDTFNALLLSEVKKLTPQQIYPIQDLIDFRFDSVQNRFCSISPYPFLDVVYYKADDAARIFGLPALEDKGFRIDYVSGKYIFPFSPSMRTANTLCFYSDVIEFDYVGDETAPLLRAIDISGESGDIIHNAIDKPFYKHVSRKVINTLGIEILSEKGKQIRFNSGEVSCILHFRRST